MIQRIMCNWQDLADRFAKPVRITVAACFLTVACWIGCRHMILNAIHLARSGPAWEVPPAMLKFADSIKAKAGRTSTILFVTENLDTSRGRVWREILYPVNVVFVTPEEYARSHAEFLTRYATQKVLFAGPEAIRLAGSACEAGPARLSQVPTCFQSGS